MEPMKEMHVHGIVHTISYFIDSVISTHTHMHTLTHTHIAGQWSGIVTNWYGEYAGMQFKVQTSGKIRDHFEVSQP